MEFVEPRFDKERKRSEISVSREFLQQPNYVDCIVLKPHIPQGVTDQKTRIEPTLDSVLKTAVPIADFATRKEEVLDPAFLNKSVPHPRLHRVDEDGTHFIEMPRTKDGLLMIGDLPDFLIGVVEAAYVDELRMHSSESLPSAEVMVAVDDQNLLQKQSQQIGTQRPHYDFRNLSPRNVYFLVSAPSTVQYTGIVVDQNALDSEIKTTKSSTEWIHDTKALANARASSLIPWKLYRGGDRFLHSSPWETANDTALESRSTVEREKRFLIRIAFYRD